ncbi:MAG: 1-(5-phosphoribosyl)-5-[(5-phosphoribosylamino)methylideneamino]imidazole-4-carboxamide isomerase [Ruminococcaceae bacterium]|nr:1-(5-phosphoribosyl)-5-[(5-phosphoribosylamino)methylideneamino]imidazole-4-carboxamide isomerase [Oscillospiraceae bacterium]
MILFPAIDLYEGKAVRLFKGDYAQMTVYSNNPMEIARDFEAKGAKAVHLVDLEGAKDGTTPNLNIVKAIALETNLFTEIGGGIRNMETVRAYLENGVDRVILGTAAVNDEAFLKEAIAAYGSRIAVGVDVKDGFVAIKGWTENSQYSCFDFCRKMVDLGVEYLICTDISKDGAMQGTNRELYRELSEKFSVNITASGGVSSLDDIQALRKLDLYGAIVGKAYYNGAIDLAQALEAAK